MVDERVFLGKLAEEEEKKRKPMKIMCSILAKLIKGVCSFIGFVIKMGCVLVGVLFSVFAAVFRICLRILLHLVIIC